MLALKDSADAEVVALTAKYAGARPIAVTIRDSLVYPDYRECIVYADGSEVEKIAFAKGAEGVGEPQALADALATSQYLDATKKADGDKTLAAMSQGVLAGGTVPDVTTADYGDALSLLEAASWNTLCVDTTDAAVHALVHEFMDRIYESGKYGLCTLTEAATIPLSTRLANAAAFNDEKVTYLLNGALDSAGQPVDRVLSAARVAGIIASTPSNRSVTHEKISGYGEPDEALTSAQIGQAILGGCLVLTTSSGGDVWIESGVNTLTNPGPDQDDGWKKIRRARARFELIERIHAATEGLIGKVNNDANGRATFIAAANGVGMEMIGEGKLAVCRIYDDPSYLPSGDSAWFVVEVQDPDSLEKIYLTYRFQFAVSAA